MECKVMGDFVFICFVDLINPKESFRLTVLERLLGKNKRPLVAFSYDWKLQKLHLVYT